MISLKEKLLEKYKKSNNENYMTRYEHSLSVAKKAVELVKSLNINVDVKKAEIAGLIHDYAKFSTMDEFFEVVKEFNLDSKILDNNFKVLHALLGPYIITKELGIDDPEILEAVECHTTGQPRMKPLQEILFLADFLEDTREEAGLIREVVKNDYKKAIALILDFKMSKILIHNKDLNDNTMKAYEYYKIYLDNDLSKVKSILKTLDHNLIKETKIYDVKRNTPLFDYVIITTALSQRQMEAASNYLKMEHDLRGLEIGESWTLVDLNDVILHIFLEEERERYSLDKLFKDIPQIVLN